MTNRENMACVFAHKMPDEILHLGSNTYGIRDYIVERPIMTTGYDAWGCHWISCPDSLGITHPDTNDIKFTDLDDWRAKTNFPDIDNLDFSSVIEEAKAFINREEQMIQYVSLNGIFERSHALMGFSNALCQSIIDPEEYGVMLAAFADHKIRLFKKMYELVEPDILVYHDDMAGQTGPFFPNEFYKKYLFSQYKRIVDAAREIGYKYVVHHSCGLAEPLIGDWLACGFDGWDSVMACNNVAKIKAEFGDKMIFMPGLETQKILGNPYATRSEIEHMVVEWMEMVACDGTGLIIDSTAAYSLNPKNEVICAEFIKKHGKTFMDAKKAGIPYVADFE